MRRDGSNLKKLAHPGAMLAILLISATAIPLFSAPQPSPRTGHPPGDAEDLKDTIEVLMIVSMKRALALTRDQELEVIPRVQQVFEARERYARERRDTLREIQLKLREESFPEKGILTVVKRLDDLERSHRDQELQLRTEIDHLLNARQQAQMRVFVPRFRREMQRRIEEARRLRVETPQPRRPVPPVEELWDTGDEEY